MDTEKNTPEIASCFAKIPWGILLELFSIFLRSGFVLTRYVYPEIRIKLNCFSRPTKNRRDTFDAEY